jgi:valyl-tRNA synthetase
MSKTKGNVVDPIEIIQRYGTDATRFTLAAMASPGTDIAFSEARTEGYRAFANKIWNAARFIFMQRDRARDAGITLDLAALPAALAPDQSATLEDRWITSRLSSTIAEVNAALADYRFDTAANIIYQFFWGDFCDWYLEIVKLRLESNSDAQRRQAHSSLTTLLAVFEASLRLLSPFMPFITEELWHALYEDHAPSPGTPKKSIALTSFPQAAAPSDPDLATSMAQLQNLVVMIRARRKDLGVPDKEAVAIVIGRADLSALSPIEDVISRLARVSHVDYRPDSLAGADIVSDANFDLQVLYEKQIDPVAERARLLKDLARLEKEWDNNQRQLSNDAFLSKAPEKVVEGLRSRAIELATLLEKTRGALASLST